MFCVFKITIYVCVLHLGSDERTTEKILINRNRREERDRNRKKIVGNFVRVRS